MNERITDATSYPPQVPDNKSIWGGEVTITETEVIPGEPTHSNPFKVIVQINEWGENVINGTTILYLTGTVVESDNEDVVSIGSTIPLNERQTKWRVIDPATHLEIYDISTDNIITARYYRSEKWVGTTATINVPEYIVNQVEIGKRYDLDTLIYSKSGEINNSEEDIYLRYPASKTYAKINLKNIHTD